MADIKKRRENIDAATNPSITDKSVKTPLQNRGNTSVKEADIEKEDIPSKRSRHKAAEMLAEAATKSLLTAAHPRKYITSVKKNKNPMKHGRYNSP
ncbi:MAG: hypothetical protein L6R37_004007 [Teloschistes peruensis]|nr:MAG: hypothetical protein L6R37_004007 [Teloschistes peruensis]